MSRIEATILRNLVNNEEYMRKVYPFLKTEYFTNSSDREVFNQVKEFVDKYNTCPTIESLIISLQNDKTISEQDYKESAELVSTLVPATVNQDWLLEETEKFCKDKAIYNAIIKSIGIIDGSDKQHSKDGIPSLLQDALGVCFDTSVGHDYFDNSAERFDFYHRVESRLPFDLSYFNKITNGGLPNKKIGRAHV